MSVESETLVQNTAHNDENAESETLSARLAALRDAPGDASRVDAVRSLVTERKGLGEEPLRRLEAARAKHELRLETSAAIGLLEAQIDLMGDEDPATVSMLRELGRMYRDELLDDEAARRVLTRAKSIGGDRSDITEELDALTQRAEKWRAIADGFVDRAEQANEASLKSALFRQAASLVWQYRRKGRAKEVDKLFKAAIAADPKDTIAARLYGLCLGARGKWNDAGKTLLNAAKKADGLMGAHVAAVAARAYGEADKPAAELEAYQFVLERDPARGEALNAVAAKFIADEEWDDLALTLEEALRARSGDDDPELLRRVGDAHWKRRGEPQDAEPFFARLRRLDPADPHMLDFYREFYADDEEKSEELMKILGDAQRGASDSTQISKFATEIAQSGEGGERAIDAWKAVYRDDPNNAEARDALKNLYRQSKKWNSLVEITRTQIDGLGDGETEQKLTLLRQLVPIYRDELKLDVMVINTYTSILELDPSDTSALVELAKTYEGLGRWNDLIQVLGQQAAATEDPAEKITLLRKQADLWIHRFANYNQATRPLEDVLEVDSSHPETLEQLREIYQRKRSWKQLFSVMEKQLPAIEDPDAALDLKLEMAKLAADRLHKHDDAIRLWKEILDVEPENVEGLDTLERLAEREKDWATLASTLERRLPLIDQEDKQIKTLRRLGTVYSEHLDDADKAGDAWRRILEIDPKNGRALRTLRDIYVKSENWDGLEALFAPTEDWGRLADVLGSAAKESEDVDTVKRLAFRAADLYLGPLDTQRRAIPLLERVVELDPADKRALDTLIPLYENAEKWGRCLELIELKLEALPNDAPVGERLTLLRQARSVSSDKVRDHKRAFQFALQAFAFEPQSTVLVEELEEAADAANLHKDLITAYEARIAGTDDPSEANRLRRRIARISGEKLGNADGAIAQLEQIVDGEDADRESLELLDRLYREQDQPEKLRALYTKRLEREGDDVELLRELAELEETKLGDTASALSRYQRILDVDPRDATALAALDRVASASGDASGVASVLERRIEVAEGEERRELLLRLAELRRTELEDSDAAIETYAQVLEGWPDEPRAVTGLEAIGEQSSALRARTAALLEQCYENAGDYEKLVVALRGRLDGTYDPEDRRELHYRLAAIAREQLDNVDMAYEALEQAFIEQPTNLDLWDAVADAASVADRHEALAVCLGAAIDHEGFSDGERVDLAARVADIYDNTIGRPEEAEPYHRRVLSLEPTNDDAFNSLKELLTNQERWADLKKLYETRIEHTLDAGAKQELLLQLCFVCEEILERPADAVGYYQQVVELEPDHPTARRSLERLFHQTAAWPELVAHLEEDLHNADGQERIELLLRLGELCKSNVNEPGRAVDHFEGVLEMAPTHLRAQEALQELLAVPAERQRVAQILEPIYESQGAYSELASVLSVQLESQDDAGSQVSTLLRIGDLLSGRVGDPEGAFDALARAVKLDPADASVREQLSDISVVADLHGRRAQVLSEVAASLEDDTSTRAEVQLELAALLDLGLGDSAKAEEAYLGAIESDPDNPDRVLEASKALERLHVASGDHRALASDLRRQVKFQDDPDERNRLRRRLGEVLERSLADTAGAIEVHRERVEADPRDEDALIALERLYTVKEEWEHLVEVLRMREEVVEDPSDQRDLLFQVAQIQEQRLGQKDEAMLSYAEVAERFSPDRPANGALASLYESSERWEDLLEVLRSEEELAESDAESVGLKYRIGELMRTRTNQAEESIDLHREVLELDPSHEGSAAALEALMRGEERFVAELAANTLIPHYEGKQAYSSLLGALDVLAQTDELATQLGPFRRAIEVSELGLDDTTRAFDYAGKALRAGAGHEDLPRLLEDFKRLAAMTESWETYATRLQEVAGDVYDESVQTSMFLDVANIASNQLADRELAKDYYRRALGNRPEDTVALDALESLYERGSQHRELFEVLERKTELASDPNAQVPLLLRQGALAESHLEDDDTAIEAFDRAAELSPSAEAFGGLDRLYRKHERWSDLVASLERQLDVRVGAPVELRYQLGAVHHEKLDDGYSALEHFGQALSIDATHEATSKQLESMMEGGEYRSQAAELLEPVYLARSDWPRVTAALEARLADETGLPERKALLLRLGQLHEEYLEDLDGALESYGRLFREDPRDRDVWDTLARLGRTLENWKRVADIQGEGLAETDVVDDETCALAFRTAHIYEERANAPQHAEPFYAKALEFSPDDSAAFEALERVRRGLGMHEELLALYREQGSAAGSDSDRAELWRKGALLLRDQLERPDDAIDLFREVIESSPRHPEALREYDALLESAERFDELADHIRHRLDVTEDLDAEVELRHRLAEIQRLKLDDRNGAIDTLEETLDRQPDHQPTIATLEGLVQGEEDRLRITKILEQVYIRQDEWRKLIAIYEAQVDLAESQDDQVEVLGRIANLHEERNENKQLALHALSRALVVEPTATEVRAEVDRLAAELGAWADHVKVYGRAVEASQDPTTQVDLLHTMGEVQHERLNLPNDAIATYQRIAELDPDDAVLLDKLETLQTLVGDWAGVAKVLEQRVERSYEPAERGGLHRRIGAIRETQLDNVEGAIESYEAALAEDPTDEEAFEPLDRLRLAQGDHEALADVLRRRMDAAQTSQQRIEFGLRMGALYAGPLNEPEEAIRSYEGVRDESPSNGEAVSALAGLYEKRGMWPELIDNLKLRAGVSDSPDERVALTFRVGEILEKELDSVSEAIDTYEVALSMDSRYEPALGALLRVSALEDYLEPAANILEPLLQVHQRWPELATVIERRVNAAQDPEDVAKQQRRLADVLEHGQRNLPAAYDAMVGAFESTPHDEDLSHELERLAAATGEWSRTADVFTARAQRVSEPETAKRLLIRAASIAEHRLDNVDRAIQSYNIAAQHVGDDDELLSATETLLERKGDHDALGEILTRRIAIAEDPAERSELWVKLGMLREQHFGDVRGALSAYQEVVERDPTNARALDALERIAAVPDLAQQSLDTLERCYRDTNSLDRVVALYDLRIDIAETNGERVRLHQEAAKLWEEDLGRTDQAMNQLSKALSLDPRDPTLLDEVERLAGASGDWGVLRGLVERIAEQPDLDAELKRDLNHRAAMWYRDRIGDPEAAEGRLRAAIAADPEAEECHQELCDLLRAPGQELPLADALLAWVEVDRDRYSQVERLMEAAELLRAAGDNTRAADCYERVLRLESDHSEALRQLAALRIEDNPGQAVELLERLVKQETDPDARLGIRREIAALYGGPLNDSAKAMTALAEVLDDDPDDRGALTQLAVLYENSGKTEELNGVLTRLLELASSDEETIDVRMRLARLYETGLSQPNDAIEQLREVLQLDPGNVAALDELERLLTASEQWDDVCQLLEWRADQADAAGDSEAAVAMRARLGRMIHEKLGDAERAATVYVRVLEVEPYHDETLQALVSLYSSLEAWDHACAALERRLEVVEPADGVALAHELAEISELKLEDYGQAETALRRAVELDQTDTSFGKLKAFYLRIEAFERYVDLLGYEAEQASDTNAKVALLKEAATVRHEKLEDPAGAALHLAAAAELSPNDREILLPLCDLYIAGGQEQQAVPVLQQIIESYGKRRVKELALYHHKLAKALEGMGDREGALKHLDSAFRIDLTNISILKDLGRMCLENGDLARAQKTFRALLLQRLKPDDGITKAEVYFQLGKISAQQDDTAKAISMLERSLSEDREHAGARALLDTLRS